ncbi:L-arabinose isomerase [Neobacillus notoginsengisoli]|uniref:L-arabinose isomerase n=1 Tax=Neobacillus notoginsengisoli TaxID=1578198 RepID=A0A417YZ28_9BACI|nr:L-arabinose isomerase [Neobacillus notoginsengisoli]RHW42770.1 L-arabinose isomerase [Neobacillus notoginsengisoli]
MIKKDSVNIWFVAGSQHLYGEETLEQVRRNSQNMADFFNREGNLPFKIEFKGVLTTSKEILQFILEVNADPNCAGVITWMHTFSPGKMWMEGLSKLQKPLCHLHTQFNRSIPWETIDMDYMNLHQSAHGDREFGYTAAYLKLQRKVIVGYWKDEGVLSPLKNWMYSAASIQESRNIRIARFGDNMRHVASTEGDKLQGLVKLGWTVDYYGVGDLVERIGTIPEEMVDRLFGEYAALYDMEQEALAPGWLQDSIKEQARIELGLESFLQEGGYTAFTTNFEDLHGLSQLPGLAVQRLMKKGYGFAGEGDWKTAGLTRLMKVASGNTGTSFMEDYTYDLEPGNELTLGAHMLEICPTIAAKKPRIAVHPLSIGNKDDPARLVFEAREGRGIVASLVQIDGRFRLVVNEVEVVEQIHKTPALPLAKALWKPLPSLAVAAEAWIHAGGSHHTVLSLVLSKDHLYDMAEMLGIECVIIDGNTELHRLKQELKINEFLYGIRL